jgi:NNP family nitrate/nitrite transporter-like MFS transporter
VEQVATAKSHKALFLNTVAFTICFAAWMLNGVLVTFLSINQVFDWGPVEIGWLIGIPVLTGAIFRLPAGMLTDKFGGKPVYTTLLFLCAVPMYLLSYADSFLTFALCSFGFGLTGASFAIGIAFTSVWYPKANQGTALGIFGVGNTGAALTTLFAPTLLNHLTDHGANLEAWRTLPVLYAAMLAVMGVLFFLLAENKKPARADRGIARMLSPLRNVRVWRFGLYYFLLFGCFVGFSQWLVPYFVNVYYLPLVTAGILAGLFSLPSGVTRAVGGWVSDKLGARQVMYWVLGFSVLITLMLSVPKMEIYSSGMGVMATRDGTVTEVSEMAVVVDDERYPLLVRPAEFEQASDSVLVLPTKEVWQESVVVPGQEVERRELLAKGVTRIYFQANVWIFAGLVIVLGGIWGVGMADVFKHIPDYFPEEVGVVGGMVGVLGGLGGFVCPIVFGYLLEWAGLWTSAWMFMFVLSIICFTWMHWVVMKLSRLPSGFEAKFASLLRGGAGKFLKPLISWDDEFSIGIETVDRQHTRMMHLINEIDEVVQEGGTYEQFAPILNDLIDYTNGHFAHEEKLLKENHCPDFERHKRAHVNLREELSGWKDKVVENKTEDMNELMVFLKIWFPGHILDVDKKDAAYLTKRREGEEHEEDELLASD